MSDWKRCERFVIHVKSRNGKRNKFDLQKRSTENLNHKSDESLPLTQSIHTQLQEKGQVTEATKYMYICY